MCEAPDLDDTCIMSKKQSATLTNAIDAVDENEQLVWAAAIRKPLVTKSSAIHRQIPTRRPCVLQVQKEVHRDWQWSLVEFSE